MTRLNLTAAILLSLFVHTSDLWAQPLNKTRLDSLVRAVDDHDKMMGALTISQNGNILYNKAWGYRFPGGKEFLKSNTDTKFRIGSISKMFTAIIILQLTEEGKLKLTDRLAGFYPSVPNAGEITIEQLLNHHSGLYNFTDSSYTAYRTQNKTHGEMLAMFEKQAPSFAPGEKAAYSNTNYVLLGYIIEKITGDSYAENIRKRITGKIGLKNTYCGAKADPGKNEALSFRYNAGKWEPEPETDMSIPGGAGSLVSTTNDLVKFAEALFAGKLVSKASLAKMTDIKDRYGLGIFQFPFDEKYAYGHTGGIDEFHSMLGYFPEDKLAFAFTGNAQTMEMNDLAIGVLSICFNRPYEIPDYGAGAYLLADEQLTRYEGTYTSSQMPLKITVKKEGPNLMAQATGQGAFPLTPVSEKEFKFDPARIKMLFEIAGEGEIRQFVLEQGGGKYVFVKE